MARPKKKTENEVIKASAAIQIEGKITLLQRRAWNVLLANAYDELPYKDRYAIRIVDLTSTLEFNSDNDEYLKIALEALVGSKLKWNLLDKDGHMEWGVAALLAGAKIVRGICIYTYEPMLREKLYNPAMYARLSLLLQNRFESKHALCLWELCTDYLGAKRDFGETPWIPLEDFRKLMGIEDSNYYTAFKHLQQKIIIPALAEINHISDLNVTTEYQRLGRKVTALKLKIRRMALLPESAHTQPPLFPELDDMPLAVKELTDAGLSTQDALQIWQQGFGFVEDAVRPKDSVKDAEAAFVQYVREKIHLLKRRQTSNKVDNSTGFLREAIKKNYANPEYSTAKQEEARREQEQAAANVEKKRQALAQQKAEIEAAQDQALQTLYGQIMADEPEVIAQAVAVAMQEAQGLNFLYERDKSTLQNYQDRPAIQALVNPYVERHAPERFQTIKEQYSGQIAVIDTQLAALFAGVA